MLPADFTRIRHKLETTTVLSSAERKEWLSLLPRMTESQTRELDRILSAAPPPAPVHPPRLTTVDAIKALAVKDLRRAPSVYKFLADLAEQFRKLPPLEAEEAFEQSELYKAYVKAGVRLMEGDGDLKVAATSGGHVAEAFRPPLTHEEVEAITDFRANIRKQ